MEYRRRVRGRGGMRFRGEGTQRRCLGEGKRRKTKKRNLSRKN
jgi:hypothetical protein